MCIVKRSLQTILLGENYFKHRYGIPAVSKVNVKQTGQKIGFALRLQINTANMRQFKPSLTNYCIIITEFNSYTAIHQKGTCHFDNNKVFISFDVYTYCVTTVNAQFEFRPCSFTLTKQRGAATKAFSTTTQPESVLRCFIE